MVGAYGQPLERLASRVRELALDIRGVSRWRDAGIWDRIVLALAGERDLAQVFIDSTIVRAQIEEALEFKGTKGDLALASEWTSLPGGKENAHRLTADKRPMDMAYFQMLFEQYLKNEKAMG